MDIKAPQDVYDFGKENLMGMKSCKTGAMLPRPPLTDQQNQVLILYFSTLYYRRYSHNFLAIRLKMTRSLTSHCL